MMRNIENIQDIVNYILRVIDSFMIISKIMITKMISLNITDSKILFNLFFSSSSNIRNQPQTLKSSIKITLNSNPIHPNFTSTAGGAGPDCDGQVLVFHDLVGLSYNPSAKFVRSYANLRESLHQALVNFRVDVGEGCFPADRESYHWTAAVREQFERETTRSA